MRYLTLGDGKSISKIGLGTWQFGAAEWGYGAEYARTEAAAIVNRAVELGVTLFDTAEIYSAGNSERILGKALQARRDSVFIATKFFPLVPAAWVVTQSAAASSRRLGLASLDLYQVHWPNPLIGDAAIMRAMRSLQRSGRIAEVGVSCYSVARWRSAEESLGSRILCNQVEYSLVARSPELTLIPFAESCGRVIIAFSPLAQGLLSGRYHGADRPTNRVRAGSMRFSSESIERTRALKGVMSEVAAAHDASVAQIALAWTIRCPAVVAIPGAASVEQVETNAAAAEIDLADDEYEALNTASAYFRPSESTAESREITLGHMKHLVKGGLLLAKTMRDDRRHRHEIAQDG
jgi:aryl-alcohol dehydrogenase-like predicted oxidoreductase